MEKIETYLGEHIDTAAKRAVKLAVERQEPVLLSFNSVDLIVAPTRRPQEVVVEFLETLEQRQREREATPEWQRGEQERAERVRSQQARLNELVASVDKAVASDLSTTIDWLGQFIPLADNVGVTFNHELLAAKLALVAEENAHVGQPPEWIQESPRRAAQYIIGQVINMLRRGMPPHPMLGEFIKQRSERVAAIKSAAIKRRKESV